ncbi:MAG: hypothetical protein ABI076_09735 [Acidobacteriaceae bacterium]
MLACGLPLTVGLQAQSYSSSKASYNFMGAPQYSPQYSNSNSQYRYNQPKTPRYTGEGWGSHFVFEGGAGVTPPAGNTQNFANTGYNILAGAGLKFNDRLSVLAEWNFNRLGMPDTLAGIVAGTPSGNEHLWTLDLNPKFNFIHGDRMDGYVIGGGGFSRALVNYTVPVLVPCGYYYGYGYGYGGGGYGYGYGGGCVGNVTVAHTSSNQGNFDIGLGAEWHLSPYSRGKFFLEARYERLFTPDRGPLPPGPDAAYIPVTAGFRW